MRGEGEQMVNIDLSGEHILVTGAAGGIGRTTALRLAEAGASIVAIDIQEDALNQLQTKAPSIRCIRCNLSDVEEVERTLRITNSEKAITSLVHCAGIISYRKGVQSVTQEEWNKVIDINLGSAFTLCSKIIGKMKQRGSGSIVLLSSLAAEVGGIEVGVHYAASKAGLIGFLRTLAKEAGPHGVRVNAVAPGIVATGPVLDQIAGHRKEYDKSIPLGRIAKPEEIADVILFLCSDLSRYITGSTIDVNGGLYMG